MFELAFSFVTCEPNIEIKHASLMRVDKSPVTDSNICPFFIGAGYWCKSCYDPCPWWALHYISPPVHWNVLTGLQFLSLWTQFQNQACFTNGPRLPLRTIYTPWGIWQIMIKFQNCKDLQKTASTHIAWNRTMSSVSERLKFAGLHRGSWSVAHAQWDNNHSKSLFFLSPFSCNPPKFIAHFLHFKSIFWRPKGPALLF